MNQSATASPTRLSKFKIFQYTLYVIFLIAYAYMLYDGISFYSSPFKERPHHEQYRVLRPAGLKSHTFGVVGSTFMILMLMYSIRKRAKFMRNRGALSRWLDIHIFFGVTGPLLVVLHTSFKVQGLVAVSFWSMVAVATSGIFGRYLYLQIPRNIQGDEIGIKDLEDDRGRIALELKRDYSLSDEVIASLEKRDSYGLDDKSGAVKVLFTIIKDDLMRPFRFRHRHKDYEDLRHIPREMRRKVIRVAHRRSLLSRKILLLNQVQQLFHYWHVLHKPFAIIMYTIMLIHIAVAIWTGYTWIF